MNKRLLINGCNLWLLHNFTFLIKSSGPPVPCTVGVPCVASGPVSGDCSCLLSSDVWQQRASAAEDTTAILRQWSSLHSPARRGGYCPRYQKGRNLRDKGQILWLSFLGSQIFQIIIAARLCPPAAFCLDSALWGLLITHHHPRKQSTIQSSFPFPLPPTLHFQICHHRR